MASCLEVEAFLISRVRFKSHTSVRWNRALLAQKKLKVVAVLADD